jgi:hypothetical protein
MSFSDHRSSVRNGKQNRTLTTKLSDKRVVLEFNLFGIYPVPKSLNEGERAKITLFCSSQQIQYRILSILKAPPVLLAVSFIPSNLYLFISSVGYKRWRSEIKTKILDYIHRSNFV